MSCHSVCPLIVNVARQTGCPPRAVAVSALRSVANPTKICQLCWLIIKVRFPHGRQPASPTRHKRVQKYRPTTFHASSDLVGNRNTNDPLICNKRASVCTV